MKTHLLSTLSGDLNANIIATVVGGLIVTLVSFICKLAYDKFRGRNSQDIPQPKTPDAVAAESKNTNTRYCICIFGFCCGFYIDFFISLGCYILLLNLLVKIHLIWFLSLCLLFLELHENENVLSLVFLHYFV